MIEATEGNSTTEKDRTRPLLELLYHVSRELATALDLHTLLHRVLVEAIDHVGGERGSIVVLDEAGDAVDSTVVFGEEVQEDMSQKVGKTVEQGLAGWVVRNRKPALITDTSQDGRWVKRPSNTGSLVSKSAVCVPLLAREKLVGVMTLVHSQADAFGPEHLELMQAIADQAGIAVLNASLYAESQRQARVMSALAESAAAIRTSLRFEEVLQSTLDHSLLALQVETVALALIDPLKGDLVFHAATGQDTGNILKQRIPAGTGLAGEVVTSEKAVMVPDVSTDKRFTDDDRFEGIETRGVAIAPITSQGKVIGILEAINPVSGVFDSDSLVIMIGIGNLAGINIQNAQLFEQLEAAHQRYRELFESSTDPILITTWEGDILEGNRQAAVTSLYPGDELQGMKIDQVHDVDWNKIGKKFENLDGGRPCNYQSKLKKKNGQTIDVQVSARAVNFEDANVLQWALHDISERKALDDLRSDLNSMVYHDLRSPLANIISSLHLISDLVSAEDNDDVHTVLEIAANSTKRIERLVDSLLDINRLESGQEIINRAAVQLDEMVYESISLLQPSLDNRNQVIKTQVPKKLPAIWVDKDMILRVILNILENAMKFTPIGSKITVKASVQDGWVKVSTSDKGPGIPASESERIFKKYIRLRRENSTAGLGIGLAFCKLAVEGHGGKIWVESQSDEGATFVFTLPVATKEQLKI